MANDRDDLDLPYLGISRRGAKGKVEYRKLNQNLVPITTIIDIFALFNRKELFNLSKVCRRYNSFIQQKFTDAPHLVFDLLVRGSRWKWAPNEENETSNMQTRLVPLLKASKFVRFRNTVFRGRSLEEELAPVKHVFDGQGLNGHSNATVDLVRKCRYLTIEMSSAADDAIFSGLLSNNHDGSIFYSGYYGDLPEWMMPELQLQ